MYPVITEKRLRVYFTSNLSLLVAKQIPPAITEVPEDPFKRVSDWDSDWNRKQSSIRALEYNTGADIIHFLRVDGEVIPEICLSYVDHKGE